LRVLMNAELAGEVLNTNVSHASQDSFTLMKETLVSNGWAVGMGFE